MSPDNGLFFNSKKGGAIFALVKANRLWLLFRQAEPCTLYALVLRLRGAPVGDPR